MSPVHVIVGEDERARQMWASAFTGAVDIYGFARNIDAFERLTVAQAPVDLVILTPAQHGPFNLTPDQFIARVMEGPLARGPMLENLHIIVVGTPVTRKHARVMAVSTLDAAIRLVKFGEVEQAPMPSPVPMPTARPAAKPTMDVDLDSLFAGSVISRIWDAPAPERSRPAVHGGGPRPTAATPPAAAVHTPMAQQQLFARTRAGSFVVGGGPATATPAPGHAAHSEPQLQPARAYQLPAGGGYRGPSTRGGQVHAAMVQIDAPVTERPAPPALAAQVHNVVYGGMQVGNPSDPLLTFSTTSQTPARTLPLEPPAGAYAPAPTAPAQSAPAVAPALANDPFLRRAEQAGGSVSFG